MARPSKYRAEFAEQARKLCLLGATDAELAGFFGVGITTIDNWKRDHVAFLGALKEGKDQADAEVAEKLFRRATGYSHEAVKIFNDQGVALVVPYTEHYPPDTTAAIFWLKNRQRARWRDKVDHELSGKTQTEMTIGPSGPDLSKLTDGQLAELEALLESASATEDENPADAGGHPA